MAHRTGLALLLLISVNTHAYDVGSFLDNYGICCAYRTSLRYAINGLLQRPCDVSGIAGHITPMKSGSSGDRRNVFTVCWDNRRHYGFIAG